MTEHSDDAPFAGSGSAPSEPPDDDLLAGLAPAEVVEVDLGEGAPRAEAPGRRIFVAVAAVTLAVALLAGAMSILGASGANDPEEPVRQLLDALGEGDLVGMAEALALSEREFLGEPALALLEELKRLEVLDPELSLGAVGGVGITPDVTLEAQTVAEDVANVHMTGGTVTLAFDPADLPLGDLVTGRLPTGVLDGVPAITVTQRVEGSPFLTVVQEDGRWYVSLFHTLAEQGRESAGREYPTAPPVPSVGAERPEDVLQAMVDKALAGDLEGVLGLLAPDESLALRRYAPLFLPAAEADMEPALEDVIVDLDTSRVDVDGDTYVVVDSVYLEMQAFGATIRYRYADGCISTTVSGFGPDQVEDHCADDQLARLEALGLPAGLAELGGETPGLRVVEVDGRWYLAPVRAAFDAVLGVARSLDRPTVEGLVDWVGEIARDPFALAALLDRELILS
jgi:hypothetical protein